LNHIKYLAIIFIQKITWRLHRNNYLQGPQKACSCLLTFQNWAIKHQH